MISKQLETNEKQGIQSAFHTAALLPRIVGRDQEVFRLRSMLAISKPKRERTRGGSVISCYSYRYHASMHCATSPQPESKRSSVH